MNTPGRTAWRAHSAAVFAIGLVAAGCYRYVPADVATVDPQEDVRIVVTEQAAARLSRDLGMYTTSLDGRLREEAHDSLSISVPVTRAYQGRVLDSGWQTLFLGRTEVLGVQRRELSRTKTVAAGVGAVAVLALIVNTIVQWVDPNPSSEESPPPPPGASMHPSGSIALPSR